MAEAVAPTDRTRSRRVCPPRFDRLRCPEAELADRRSRIRDARVALATVEVDTVDAAEGRRDRDHGPSLARRQAGVLWADVRFPGAGIRSFASSPRRASWPPWSAWEAPP